MGSSLVVFLVGAKHLLSVNPGFRIKNFKSRGLATPVLMDRVTSAQAEIPCFSIRNSSPLLETLLILSMRKSIERHGRTTASPPISKLHFVAIEPSSSPTSPAAMKNCRGPFIDCRSYSFKSHRKSKD